MIIEPLVVIDRLTKEVEPITDYKDLVVKEGINKYDPITFMLHKTEANSNAFVLIENENFIEFEGHQYRIKQSNEYLRGNTPVKVVTNARHRFYDLLDIQRDTTLSNGFKSINTVLSFIFTGTRWSFTVIDPFGTVEFENFGNDNCLNLFNKVIERYGAEFDIIGTEVRITLPAFNVIDMQFRHNHNIKTFKKNINSSNLSTKIKGYGKRNEDGTPIVEAEYISPYASLYTDDNGNIEYRDAPPYSNETIINEATLITHLQANIQDTPEVSFELEFTVLQDAGYSKPMPTKGDLIPTILEELGVDVDLKIMEIERYPNTQRSPKVSLGSIRKSADEQLKDYSKNLLGEIWDENSKTIKYNVYNEAVKKATEMLNNSLTELEYPPGMGIIARDPNDPNKFVAFRSEGIGVTSNNGLSFENAITSLGVTTSLLTAGQILTNNIQIIGNSNLFYWDGNYLIAIDANDPKKFVKLNSAGLYVAKGMITVEREDGFKTIIGGRANFDQNVFPRLPIFVKSADILNERMVTNSGTNEAIGGQFSFRHTQRFLKFEVNLATETSGTTTAFVEETNNTGVWLSSTTSTAVLDSDELKVLTVDLGVPAGAARSVYTKFKTNTSLSRAFMSIVRYYQSDF